MSEATKTATSRAEPSNNPIVNLIDGSKEKSVDLTAVDAESQYNPWNSDDLYQKFGNYSAYEDMMKDDQVSVAMAVKKDLIIGSGWHIAVEEEGDEAIKQDLEIALTEDIEVSLDDCLSNMLTAYEIGFSVAEKQFKMRADGSLTVKNIKVRNPVSWLFHQDQYGNITRYEQQGATAEFSDIDRNSLIHFVNNPRYGRPYGTSDLRAAYAAWFIKTQIIRYYAIFLEKAASPVPVAKYDRNLAQTPEVTSLYNTIKKFQASTAMVLPKDFEIEFLEVNGNGEAYAKGINMFNMFIGRALFVPDLLGFQGGETSGGSQALGREQMVVFFKHIMRRRRTIENLINQHIIKPLVIWNHGFLENYPKFKLNPIEEEQAGENAKLWLEAVKGKAFKPTLAEVNQFKRIVDFPETSEEEWEGQQQDALDQAAAMAETLEGRQAEDTQKEDDDGGERDRDEETKADSKQEFAKTYNFPPGDYHKKTNFQAIEKQLDSNLDLFIAKATPIIKGIFDKFTARLSTKNLARVSTLESLEKISLPKADVKKLEKLLDTTFRETFERSHAMAQGEIYKNNFAKEQKIKQPIYLVVGVPGSGKSWVCEQLTQQFEYVHHDGFIGHIAQPQVYVAAILEKAETASKPLLTEAPFSISSIKDPLEEAGYSVTPVFIIEEPEVLSSRYFGREGREIPKGHLSRMNTYAERAEEWGAFRGTSSQVLEFLKEKTAPDSFKMELAPEFLKSMAEENYNFIGDWNYAITKRARSEIIAAIKDGKPISSVIDAVTSDGMKASFTSVERYARTKFTEVMNKGRLEYFKSTGVIGAYQYSAILDGQTSDICAGLHGKVFKAGTEPVPPMHFNCRSVLVPITTFEEFEPDEKVGKQDIDDFIDEMKGKGFARN